ncbi:MAG: LacI family DNA-binding transcriptional regulator [Anaerolineae bacterium]|nr:LacI family DNA-binding transcriptional regulator [Anaerolineae bacterium]
MVPSRPKLQDVADLAGVSIGTASQALNNKASVLPETRERVLQAAQELGYELPARTTTPEHAISTLGVLVKIHPGQNIPIDPFYGAVLSGAEQECKRRNISLMYASMPVDELSNVIEWPPLVNDQQVDGWLILGAFLQDAVLELEQRLRQPIILVDAYAPDSNYDIIVTDNVTGAYNAVTYLIDRGHRNIGLIGSTPDGSPSVRERRQGYLKALAEHGIEQAFIEDSPLHGPDVYTAAQTLFNRAPEITAIFACNDDVAIAVMRAGHDLGLRVPDDFSLVGFDDLTLASEVIPPLTSVFVDQMLMGALGVRQLLDRSEHPDRVPFTITLGTRLIERQSVRTLTNSS